MVGLLYDSSQSAHLDIIELDKYIKKEDGYFNSPKQFVYSILSSIFFLIGHSLILKTKKYIHHSIDTVFTALALTLVMPSCIFSNYSNYPVR